MKQKDALISIVIPVYNVESYIEKCVNSIINQTYKNIEILLIDDGSTDLSGQICELYAKKDTRIRVFHKKNGGLSSARNFGIEKAKGKYISFIDSDDFVTIDYVEILYKLLVDTNSDISVAINVNLYPNGYIKHIYNNSGKKIIYGSGLSMLEHMLYQKLFDTSSSFKLYKTKLFDDIRFPIGKLYEDIACIYKLFLKAKRVSYINKEIYFYLQRPSSIIGKSFDPRDMDLIDSVDLMMEEIKKIDRNKNLNGKLIKAMKSRLLSANFLMLKRIGFRKEYGKYTERCINNIKKYKQIDLKSRFKNNVAVILFYINPKLIAKF